MSLLTLTPTPLPKTGATAPLNLTALTAAGTLGANTGVTWTNTGREVLVVNVAAGGSTCSIVIGTTIEGQTPPPLTPVLVASAWNVIGPFPSDEENPAGMMTVNFGTAANVTVSLLQTVGVL